MGNLLFRLVSKTQPKPLPEPEPAPKPNPVKPKKPVRAAQNPKPETEAEHDEEYKILQKKIKNVKNNIVQTNKELWENVDTLRNSDLPSLQDILIKNHTIHLEMVDKMRVLNKLYVKYRELVTKLEKLGEKNKKAKAKKTSEETEDTEEKERCEANEETDD